VRPHCSLRHTERVSSSHSPEFDESDGDDLYLQLYIPIQISSHEGVRAIDLVDRAHRRGVRTIEVARGGHSSFIASYRRWAAQSEIQSMGCSLCITCELRRMRAYECADADGEGAL
jgi:hypothetical protein